MNEVLLYVGAWASEMVPKSMHHEFDSCPGHSSRWPNLCRKGSNSLRDIAFMMMMIVQMRSQRWRVRIWEGPKHGPKRGSAEMMSRGKE